MSLIAAKLPKALAIACAPGVTPGLWAEILDPFMWQWGIKTPRKIAAFIGQVSIESAGFSGLRLLPLLGGHQSRFAAYCQMMPGEIGDYLRTPKGAAESACWAWSQVFDLNPAAEAWMLTAISKKINGSVEGLQARIDMCNKVLKVVS